MLLLRVRVKDRSRHISVCGLSPSLHYGQLEPKWTPDPHRALLSQRNQSGSNFSFSLGLDL